MDRIDDICYGCFGASFGDCQDCPTRKRYKIALDVNEIKMYSDLHNEEEENGKKEKVL